VAEAVAEKSTVDWRHHSAAGRDGDNPEEADGCNQPAIAAVIGGGRVSQRDAHQAAGGLA
jgi:hypothetical protein